MCLSSVWSLYEGSTQLESVELVDLGLFVYVGMRHVPLWFKARDLFQSWLDVIGQGICGAQEHLT